MIQEGLLFFAHHTAEPEIVGCLVGIYYTGWLELANRRAQVSRASLGAGFGSASADGKEGVSEERSHNSGEYGREDS